MLFFLCIWKWMNWYWGPYLDLDFREDFPVFFFFLLSKFNKNNLHSLWYFFPPCLLQMQQAQRGQEGGPAGPFPGAELLLWERSLISLHLLTSSGSLGSKEPSGVSIQWESPLHTVRGDSQLSPRVKEMLSLPLSLVPVIIPTVINRSRQLLHFLVRSETLYMGEGLNFLFLGSFEKWTFGGIGDFKDSGVEKKGKMCQA